MNLFDDADDDLPLAPWDQDRFYGGGEAGYTDYPRYNDKPA